MTTVLYVDDEPTLLEVAKEFLERDGELKVETSNSAMDALVRLETRHIDAVVCDYQMPVVDGLNFLKTIRLQGRRVPFILFTGKGREDVVIEALNNGADFYLQKGGDPKAQFTELSNMIKRSVDQRRAAESLEESEQIYEKLFKENIEAMVLVDPKSGAIVDANGSAVRFFGHGREELLGKHVSELSPAIASHGHHVVWQEGLGRGTKVNMALRLASGEEREAEIFSGTLRVKGRQLGYAMIHDITELRRAQRREERMSKVFKMMSFASQLVLHAASEIELLEGTCKGVVEYGGYRAAWIGDVGPTGESVREISKAERDVATSEGRSVLEMATLEGLVGKVRSSMERTIVVSEHRAGGKGGPLAYAAYPIATVGGVGGVLVVVSDTPPMEKREELILGELADNLSEAVHLASERERLMREAGRRATEEKLWETGSKLRAIIQTSPMAIVSLDPDGTIATWNPAAERVFGWGGTGMDSARLPLGNDVESQGLLNRMLGGDAISDHALRFKDRAISMSSAPIRDQEGEVTSIIVVASDITERKAMEDRMLQLNDILRLVNRILRHDTLNELMVLSGSLEMYQRTKQERFLDTAAKAVARSVEMIRRMKELESLAASGGATKLYDLRQTVENVLRGYMVEFSVEGEGSIFADDALPSAIDNIVRNAMIHGKAERIEARVWSEDRRVMLRIADNGMGIPDAIKKRIFDEGFSYGASAGTGLGLYLVTKAVERYRGKVSVEDNQPRGSAFVLSFPSA